MEHVYPIRLSKKIEQPIRANLIKLRRLYLFTNDIADDFPQLKVYGPGGNKSLRGNIVELNLSQNLVTIRVKNKSGDEIVIQDPELFTHIRAWVR